LPDCIAERNRGVKGRDGFGESRDRREGGRVSRGWGREDIVYGGREGNWDGIHDGVDGVDGEAVLVDLG